MAVKVKKIGFIFASAPHGNVKAREGLDAVLSAASLLESWQIGLFFINNGVLQLLPDQQPNTIFSRDYISSFQALPLYGINQCYLCQNALFLLGLSMQQTFIIDVKCIPAVQLRHELAKFHCLLTF